MGKIPRRSGSSPRTGRSSTRTRRQCPSDLNFILCSIPIDNFNDKKVLCYDEAQQTRDEVNNTRNSHVFVRTWSPMNTNPSLSTGSYFAVSQIRGVAPQEQNYITRTFQWIKELELFDNSNRSSSHTASSCSMAEGHADIWLSPVVNWFNCILIYVLHCLGRMRHTF